MIKHKRTRGFKTKSGVYVSPGNIKVHYPIINVGAAMDCPSRGWCPFDIERHRASGRLICYAQNTERLRPNVLTSRRNNERIIREEPIKCAEEVAAGIVKHMKKHKMVGKQARTVRLNESSDIAAWNIDFTVHLVHLLKTEKIRVFLYSKAPAPLRHRMTEAGATVLHSEHDFVAVKSEAESPLTLCPGVCGAKFCHRCPDGKQSKIIEH